jgi:hypothetical protein
MSYHFFRKPKKPTTVEEPLMVQFKTWQVSIERNRDLQVANQHCQQVLTIWFALDKRLSVEALKDLTPIRDEWLPSVQETLAPGTRKSYLGIL